MKPIAEPYRCFHQGHLIIGLGVNKVATQYSPFQSEYDRLTQLN